MSVVLNLHQAQQLLEFFGGEDASVTVSKLHNHAHSGPGVYAWITEHPGEGSIKLDEEPSAESGCERDGGPVSECGSSPACGCPAALTDLARTAGVPVPGDAPPSDAAILAIANSVGMPSSTGADTLVLFARALLAACGPRGVQEVDLG